MKRCILNLLLLPALLISGCGDNDESLVLSVAVTEPRAGADAKTLVLWAKTFSGSSAALPRSAQHRLVLPAEHDFSTQGFEIEIEDSRSLSGTMFFHIVAEADTGRALGWASVQLDFPRGGTVPIVLVPAMAACDIDGDGFPACELPSCCPHLEESLESQFEDCEDDDQGDRIIPPNPTRPGMRIRADEIHPFFDPVLEQERSYWCQNGVSNTCADEPPANCNYSDADQDGFPANEAGPNGESVGPNTDCEDARDHIHPGAEELCNGEDEDCDDEIDEGCDCQPGETRDCYEGPPGTQGVGLCRGGEQGCEAGGGWGECLGQRLPVGEQCNDQDDNCDRLVDEGCDCRAEDVRTCGSEVGTCTLGVQVCEDGIFTEECLNAVNPEADDELSCDGRDEDCDGTPDENWQIGEPCVGVGACGPGSWECNGRNARRCSTHPGGSAFFPQDEICNGVDDDCDTETDETFVLASDTNHCGRCAHRCELPNTDPLCVGGTCRVLDCHEGWYDINQRDDDGCEYDCSPVAESEQSCDGRDDNCNGQIDESFNLQEDPAHCGACQRPCAPDHGSGTCQAGQCNVVGCDNGWHDIDGAAANGCEYDCHPSGEERCEGATDEDCDGAIDEGFLVGPECTATLNTCVNEGVWVCAPDGLNSHCDAPPPVPQAEACNGEDDDCDGDLDEDVVCCGNENIEEGESCDDGNDLICDGCEDCERRAVLNTQGGTSRVHLGNNIGSRFGRGDLTIEFWVNLRSLVPDGPTILLGTGRDDPPELGIFIEGGRMRVEGPHLDDDEEITSGAGFPLDQWVHIAVQRHGRNVRLFQSGERVASGRLEEEDNGRSWSIEGALYLGNVDPPGGLNGLVDELRFSSTRRYHNDDYSPARRFSPDQDTLALWHFDEGEGDEALDATGEADNTATLVDVGWADDDGYGGRFCEAP